MRNIMKATRQVRDLLLILVTVSYALGFALWSLNAWRQGLGWIPVANTRYFLAGFPILAVFFGIYALVQLRNWLESWTSQNEHRRSYLLGTILVILTAFVLVDLLLGPITRTKWNPLPWELFVPLELLELSIFLIGMFLMTAILSSVPPSSAISNSFIRFAAIPLMVLMMAIGSLHALDLLYRKLPQEFGGFRPRRANLYLKSDLPNSFREMFLPRGGQTVEPITDSIEVLVFYADDDRLIVKIAPDLRKVKPEQLRFMPAHEIRRDAVAATTYLR